MQTRLPPFAVVWLFESPDSEDATNSATAKVPAIRILGSEALNHAAAHSRLNRVWPSGTGPTAKLIANIRKKIVTTATTTLAVLAPPK
jgi:hypothetical protein